MRTLALLYHDVVPSGQYETSGFQSPDANIYKLDCGEFERHLEQVSQFVGNGQGALSEARAAGPFQVLLTFDDGGASAATSTADLLERFGWLGHFFITADYIDRPGFLTRSQIVELHRRGHIIGSHSCSHPARMSQCSPSQLDQEWSVSIDRLTQVLGTQVSSASVPGGYYSREVAAAAFRAGILKLFTSEPVTSTWQVDGCTVFGRFSVQQGVSSEWVESLVAGEWSPRLRRYLFWNAKKAAKKLGGDAWLTFRRRVIANRAATRT